MIGMGPEMVLAQPVTKLLQDHSFIKKLGFIFIDEVHLVTQWGSSFQPAYLRLGELHA